MKGKIAIITISWLMVLLTMIMIFNFSSENAVQSTKTSENVVVQVLDIVMDKEDITPPVIKKYQFPIRKAAHFGIYMLLGFCMISAFEKSFKLKLWLNSVLSVLACVIYAISDEFHQNFSSGRGPQVRDVLIDSAGALVGTLVFLGLFFLYFKVILPKINAKNNIK